MRIPSIRPRSFIVILVLLAVVGGASAQVREAEITAWGACVVSKNDVGTGELLARTDDGLVPLPSVAVDVRLDVRGPLITGTFRQTFRNPTDETIEAVYVLPLPEGAAVHRMAIEVDGRRIVSVVRERSEARRVFEQARAEGRRTALVESERANLFTTSVANIPAGREVIVELVYLDQADYVDGAFGLAVPLTFTPRYVSPGWLRDDPDGYVDPQRLDDAHRVSPPFVTRRSLRYPRASIAVRLEPGVALDEVVSSSHDVVVDRTGDAWLVSTRDDTVPADRDLVLSWKPATSEPAAALFVEDREDGRYAMLMLVPDDGAAGADARRMPTETLFMIDVSGSMQGESIRMARKALITALRDLRGRDRFNVLRFQSSHALFRPRFEDADPGAVGSAVDWVASLQAHGGTEIFPALSTGLGQFVGADDGVPRSRRIVLITDAAVANEEQLFQRVADGLGDVRLHVVGVGSAPNRYLVDRLASYGGGLSGFVGASEEARADMTAFLKRIGRPRLADPRLAWLDAEPLETYPSRLPSVFPGELLLWSGRFQPDAELEGIFSAWDGERRLEIPLSAAPVDDGSESIAVRWARLKVADLMADHHRGDPTARADVVATALAFGLVTPFTSRVAVDEEIVGDGDPTRHRLPNGLPAGSVQPATGTARPLLRLLGFLCLGAGALALLTIVVRR